MAKYIIEFEDEPHKILADDANYYTCKQMPYWSLSESMINGLTPYTEPDIEAIETRVWEFASAIICPSDCNVGSIQKDCKEIFNLDSWELRGIFTKNTYQEAIAKYKAWKKRNEIKVGDEVYYNEPLHAKFVVVRIDGEIAFGISATDPAGYDYCELCDLTKTGRSFPEVAELIKKMKEEP